MLPDFKFGLFGVDGSLRPVIQRTFGQSQEVTVLETAATVEAYLGDTRFSKWKVLVAGWSSLSSDESLLAALRDNLLKS